VLAIEDAGRGSKGRFRNKGVAGGRKEKKKERGRTTQEYILAK